MSLATRLKSLGFDTYLFLLMGMVVVAFVLPARGMGASVLSHLTYYAVALLFFIYGARLDTAAILAGLSNWRLQGLVFASTFIVFPILGIGFSSALSPWLKPEFIIGILYIAILPSTVQSSIAFTSIAGGNVPAAVCAASISNLLGVFITPLLAGLLIHTSSDSGFDTGAIVDIAVQLLLPFAAGQAMRRFIGGWIHRHPALTHFVDRGSILLIVYAAFSAGVVAGIWQQVDGASLTIVIAAAVVLLAVIMTATAMAGRAARLPRADTIVLLFCGSKKSLASGLPMANILFAGQFISLIILPLMIFHQIQLVVCAIIAQRAAHRNAKPPGSPE